MWKVLFGNVIYYRRETKDAGTVRKFTPDYRAIILDGIPKLNFGALGGLAVFLCMFGWFWGAAAYNRATNLKWVAWLTGGKGFTTITTSTRARPGSLKEDLKWI
jgi:hypothetical protein